MHICGTKAARCTLCSSVFRSSALPEDLGKNHQAQASAEKWRLSINGNFRIFYIVLYTKHVQTWWESLISWGMINGHFRIRLIGGTWLPAIYKAYFSGLCKGISPKKYGQQYGTAPPFQDPGIPIDSRTNMQFVTNYGYILRYDYQL